jgi:hypothetical protein
LRPLWLGLGGVALLAAAMFGDMLIAPGSRVLGNIQQDLTLHFLWWREFGFGELAKGNIALWNPHIFSGATFFGNTQPALLYPPNWLFLALPLPPATNWSIALNAWLLGAFMYLWTWRRGMHPVRAGTQGSARVIREGTDFVEIDADVASPSILLVTDAWTPGWQARPLQGSSQTRYEIMPANYVLRGVALDRGKHRLRLEYAPAAFALSAVVSAIAWAAWLLAVFVLWRRKGGVARA